MRIYKTNKTVLRIQPNAKQFLNGLTSNDMDAPCNAFLNVHGRVIAIFDQYKVSDDEYLLVVEKEYVEPLLKELDRFLKIGGVKYSISRREACYDLDADHVVLDDDYVIPQVSGRLIITKSDVRESISTEEFNLFRLQNNIPLQGKDFKDEFILNVNDSQYVSYTKGCFLGQEPVAKVHNRSKPSWKLVVKSEEDCSEEERSKMTSKTYDPQRQKTLGFVFINNK